MVILGDFGVFCFMKSLRTARKQLVPDFSAFYRDSWARLKFTNSVNNPFNKDITSTYTFHDHWFYAFGTVENKWAVGDCFKVNLMTTPLLVSHNPSFGNAWSMWHVSQNKIIIMLFFQFDIGIPSMTRCCNQHDRCYDTCGREKHECDEQFQECLETICRNVQRTLGLSQTVQGKRQITYVQMRYLRSDWEHQNELKLLECPLTWWQLVFLRDKILRFI